MPSVSDKEITVARAYGSAMLRLAETSGEADSLLEELSELVSYLDKQPDLEALFASPMIDAKARQATIEKLLRGKASDLLVDSLQILNRKERLGLFREVAETYRLAHEDLRGQIDVHVRTALPLAGKLRKRLIQTAGQLTGKEAQLVETVDESLIAGIVFQIGDRKFDASVTHQLTKLSGLLRERASREIHGRKAYREDR